MTALTHKENDLHNRLIVAEFNLGQVEEELRRLREENEALRARLAQPEPEPVAWGDSSYDVDFRDDGTISVSLPDGDELVIVPPQPKQKDLEPYCYTWDKWISSGTWEAQYGWKPYYGGKRPEHVTDAKPLYTAPPQREWQGLTDEEIKAAWSQLWYELGNGKFAASDDQSRHTTIMFAKEIEAKLKEKNNAV